MKKELAQLIENAKCFRVEIGDDHWGEPDHYAEDKDLITGLEPKLYSFNSEMSGAEVLEEMEKDGYQPGNTADLLTYAINNGESLIAELSTRLNLLIALGTISPVGTSISGLGTVLKLCTVFGKLHLGTICFAHPKMSLSKYPKSTLYIAVRK